MHAYTLEHGDSKTSFFFFNLQENHTVCILWGLAILSKVCCEKHPRCVLELHNHCWGALHHMNVPEFSLRSSLGLVQITCFLVHACMQLCCVSTWNGTTRPACMLHCSKCRQTTVQSGRTKRYSHQLCLRVPTAPYPSKMKEISLTFKAWYNFRAELYFDRTSQCATSYGIQEL